jgi:hypothetical protein
MKELKRDGYGSNFNTLLYNDTHIKKLAKNQYGIDKMKKEISLYKYLQEKCIQFPVPYIYPEENGYTMKYYKEHVPLYKVYPTYSPEKRKSILAKIYHHLDTLHATKCHVSKQVVTQDMLYEVVTKIKSRMESVYSVLQPYMFITSVNSVKLLPFDIIMESLREKTLEYINSKETYEYSILHGDCQFNNILYNETTDDLLFIDPRGYFGLTDMYGLAEYDTAKVQFALSGYDIFDSMEINSLSIEGDDLRLPPVSVESWFLECPPISKYLLVSIWLGNSHCFKANPAKAAFSYFYALYLGTLVFTERSLLK